MIIMREELLKNKYLLKVVDLSGKLLLAWYVFESFRYIYTSRFSSQISRVMNLSFDSFDLWVIYDLIQIPVASVGVIILIPFILKGHRAGLIVGILYWVMGCYTNPVWFILPNKWLLSSNGEPSLLLNYCNYSWSIVTISIIISFYFYRRSIKN